MAGSGSAAVSESQSSHDPARMAAATADALSGAGHNGYFQVADSAMRGPPSGSRFHPMSISYATIPAHCRPVLVKKGETPF